MDESLYIKLADEALETTAVWLEDFDPDELDFSTTDGVVTFDVAVSEVGPAVQLLLRFFAAAVGRCCCRRRRTSAASSIRGPAPT